MKITRDDIEKKAYLLWEKDGRKPGRALDYWLQAEKELQALLQPGRATLPAVQKPINNLRPSNHRSAQLTGSRA